MPIWSFKPAGMERRGGLRKIRGYRRVWVACKSLRQRFLFPGGRGTPVFVVGAQRSGTSIFIYALDRSLHTRTFLEQSPQIQDHWRIRPHEAIREVVRAQHAPRVVMKPLWDSHRTDELLASFQGARAIWLYRWYPDVARSAVKLFGAWQRDLLLAVARQDRETAGWVMERLSPEDHDLVAELVGQGLDEEAGAALFWYLRNQFFFSLELDQDPRVLLLRYGDLVCQPEQVLRRVCEFLEIPFEPCITEDLEAGSHHRTPPPSNLPERLRERCDVLQAKLDEAYERQAPASAG